MKENVIGFYNEAIEDRSDIESFCKHLCKENDYLYYRTFSNAEELKANVREGDCIIFDSAFSLYDIETMEILSLQAKYNLKMFLKGNQLKDLNYNAAQRQEMTICIAMVNFIKMEMSTIKKLIESQEEQDDKSR